MRTIVIAAVVIHVFCAIVSASPPTNRPMPPTVAARPTLPEAGYVRTNKLMWLRRRAVPRARLNAVFDPNQVISGTRSLPVICLEFSNRPRPIVRIGGQNVPLTTGLLNNRLFGIDGGPPNQATLTQYYRDVSDRRLTVTGEVLGWYQLPNNDSFYENNRDLNGNGLFDDGTNEMVNGGGQPFGQMLNFGLQEADDDIDFGLFDNDGPDGLPNSGDDDGKVDLVFFVHPEAGAECGGLAYTNIWSHFSTYGHGPATVHGADVGSLRAFVSDDNRLDSTGQPRLAPNGQPLKIVVADYTIQPALSCSSAVQGNPRQPIDIGVFCHEFGHALGLPDLYDRTSPKTGSIDSWCLMASGSYGGDRRHSETPTHMSAWCKYYLGWSTDETIMDNGVVSITPVQNRGMMYRLVVPGTGGKEYFLAEFRDRTWQDPADATRINWDRDLPGSGLAIWHVDENVGASSPRWPFAAANQGQNDAASIPVPNANPARFRSPHALITIVQADGQNDLAAGRLADADDLFGPLQPFDDDPTLKAGSRGYDAQPTNISITNIDFGSSTMLVQIRDSNQPLADVSTAAPADAASASNLDAALSRDLNAVVSKYLASPSAPLDVLKHQLSDREQRALMVVEQCDLRRIVKKSLVPVMNRMIADARTVHITGNEIPASLPPALAQRLRQLHEQSNRPLAVRLAPGGVSVKRITGLAIPRGNHTIVQMADNLVRTDLKPILTPGATLADQPIVSTNQANGTCVHFDQIYTIDGKILPVDGARVTVCFDAEGNVTAVDSTTVSALEIHGTLSDASDDKVRDAVADRLNLPNAARRTLGAPKRCVYLMDGDATRARVVFCVTVPVGEGIRDIEVLLDQETLSVLKIE